MATRSRIGIELPNGVVHSIYSHWDGYPEHNGTLLSEHYNTRERVSELIALGDISSLKPRVKPNDNEEHSFNKVVEDVTVAYHRDRGEEYSLPRVDLNKDEFKESDVEEWGYLFTKENEWVVVESYAEKGRYFDKLENVLKKLEVE